MSLEVPLPVLAQFSEDSIDRDLCAAIYIGSYVAQTLEHGHRVTSHPFKGDQFVAVGSAPRRINLPSIEPSLMTYNDGFRSHSLLVIT